VAIEGSQRALRGQDLTAPDRFLQGAGRQPSVAWQGIDGMEKVSRAEVEFGFAWGEDETSHEIFLELNSIK
jgi:hypothetical protein